MTMGDNRVVLQTFQAQQEVGLGSRRRATQMCLWIEDQFGWCVPSSCCGIGAPCLEDSKIVTLQSQKAKVKLLADS